MSFKENLFSSRKLFVYDFTNNENLREYLLNIKDDILLAHIILHLSNTYIGKLSKHAKTLSIEDLKKLNNYEVELWPEFYENPNLTEEEKEKLLKIKNKELVKIINEMNFGKFYNIENYDTITVLKDNIYKIYDKILFLFSDIKDIYQDFKQDTAEIKIIEWMKTHMKQ